MRFSLFLSLRIINLIRMLQYKSVEPENLVSECNTDNSVECHCYEP